MLKLQYAALILLLAAGGCASQTDSEQPLAREREKAGASALELATPEKGFALDTPTTVVDPGDDVRVCEVVVLPGTPSDVYYVPRIETLLSAHGEELIVHAARPGSDTEAIMDPEASVPCTRAGEAFGEELSEVLATADRYTDESFPEGTGKVFHGGQKLALELHFVNETSEPAQARAKLAFHLADADRVQRTMRSANFANLTIYTPPGGHSSHVGECLVRQEMLVSELVRRTQRFGTTFKVWFAGGARDGQLFWESADRRDSRYEPSEPIHLMPGEGFRFECNYYNYSGRELRYGVSASDETCMLQANYAVPDDNAEEETPEGCLLFDVDPDGIARR